MIPVPTPFVGIAVHVMQSPGIGWVAADTGRPAERRSWLGAVEGFPCEIRLFAAELFSERGCRRRSGPAGIFPLCFGGHPELPVVREFAGLVTQFSEFLAECLALGEINIADGKVIPR